MAKIRVTCPSCRTELELDAAHEGQEVECGNCLEVFKANPPGSGGGPKIPAAGPRAGGSGSGGGTSRSGNRGRPAPKRRRRDDDDDYEHDRRRDDDEFDDYDPRPYRGGGGEGDSAATAALVLGIISVVMFCCAPISVLVGVIACICGGLGLKSQNNKGQAVAGLVLGVIGMGLAGLFFLGFQSGAFR